MNKIKIYVLGMLLIAFSAKAQEKETPPPGGKPKDFKLPEKTVVTLENGLELVMVPYGAIPKATINITVKTGKAHEEENQVWLSELVTKLMEEGSTQKSSKEIADKIAGMGGNLKLTAGPHTSVLSSSVLFEFVPEAIDVLADVLINPLFPESELDRLKNDMKRKLSVSLTRPQPKAMESFFASLYPDHAYGRLFPTEEMIEAYALKDIKDFYQQNYGAKRTTVYVVGKFDLKAVENAVKKAFSSWHEGPEPSFEAAEPISSGKIAILDRPNAPQSTIMMGLPVIDPTHPDYIALDVTNSLLGGSFGSRITRNIREDKGYTYSPYSQVSNNFRSAIWYEQADVTTEFTGPSLREIAKEVERLQNEPPSKEELTGIQNYQAGIYVLQNSSPGGIINQLVFLDVHNLDESFLTNKVNNIHAVTPEKIQETVKKYIKPEDMTIVIVGDKKVIEKQINEYEESLKGKKD